MKGRFWLSVFFIYNNRSCNVTDEETGDPLQPSFLTFASDKQTESHEMTIVTSVHLFFLVGTDGKWPAPEPLSKLHNDDTVFYRHSGRSRSVLRTDPCSVVDWTGKVPALPSSTTQTECTVRWSLQFTVRKGNEGGRKAQTEDRKQIKWIIVKWKLSKETIL